MPPASLVLYLQDGLPGGRGGAGADRVDEALPSGPKVCAPASRAEARDYIDVGAALRRYRPEELIRLAWSMEPGYSTENFTNIGPALDQFDDEEFTRYGLTQPDVAELRKAFRGVAAARRRQLTIPPGLTSRKFRLRAAGRRTQAACKR